MLGSVRPEVRGRSLTGQEGRRHLGDAESHWEGAGFVPSGADTLNATLMQGGVTHLQGDLK